MGYLPRNSGWYRKHFTLPPTWAGNSIWIYIEGSFHTTTAYINGAQIGYHQAGYTSFWLRLDNTSAVYGGENVLALYVDATFGTGWWYEGGGLIRHQYLVSTGSTHLQPDGTWTHVVDVEGVHPRQNEVGVGRLGADSATMVTSAEVTNHGTAATTATVRATVRDGTTDDVVGTSTSTAVTVPVGDTVIATTSTPLTAVKVWSVQSPDLYTVTVDVLSATDAILDSYNYSVGIRAILFDTSGLHLNGHPVKVRGFCDHSNFGGVGGAVPDRVNLYRTQMLRSVGANAWRMGKELVLFLTACLFCTSYFLFLSTAPRF
jgi:beta-galactosidase/beta-glucuronidase